MSYRGLARRYIYFSIAGGVLVGLILISFINRAPKPNAGKAGHRDSALSKPYGAAATETPDLLTLVLVRPPEIIATATETLSRLADEQDPRSCEEVPCLALTFDDGPDFTTTPLILDAFARQHAKASFFLVGNRIGPRGDIVKRIYREGHDIGNHSWSHANFAKLSADKAQQQVNDTQNAVMALGLPAPHLFRPPYGRLTPAQAEKINMPTIMWNIDPEDWRQSDPNKVVETIVAQAKPGGIMVLHDIKPTTAVAVERAIVELKKHYRLVTVSKLLELDADSQGVFFGR